MLDLRIFEADVVDEMVQCHMGVNAIQPCQKRHDEACKRLERTITERGEEKVEPDDVRLRLVDRAQQSRWICEAVVVPHAFYVDAGDRLRSVLLLDLRSNAIGEHGDAQ